VERIAQFDPIDDQHVADRILTGSDKLGTGERGRALEYNFKHTYMGKSDRGGGINGNYY
jgi:hypothetical protein